MTQSIHEERQWKNEQRRYWNSIAAIYDGQYNTPWSIREDEDTINELKTHIPTSSRRVLELACGTGLGYSMCQAFIPSMKYTGIDISAAMLNKFRENHPAGDYRLHSRSMLELNDIESDSQDAVLCIYTSMSFCEWPEELIAKVYRILRPGGVAFLSFVGRWSLRRLAHFKIAQIERFKTRGDTSTSVNVPAWTVSRREVITHLERAGFQGVGTSGQSMFGGLLEYELLWPLDCLLAGYFTNLCHTLNCYGCKPTEVKQECSP